MARLRNIMPTSYPGIWSNDAKDTDGQPGKWVEDMEYYQMWDDGWKYYTMMQWQYDREYHMVWSLKINYSVLKILKRKDTYISMLMQVWWMKMFK